MIFRIAAALILFFLLALSPARETQALELVTTRYATIIYENKRQLQEFNERVVFNKFSGGAGRLTAVDEALLGGTLSLTNYSVAAKTGTAQIANKEAGGYYENRFLHSMIGYFPAYDPEFLVFLMTIEPVGVRYASQTLTLPFIDVTKFLINYYEVAPDR